MVTIRKYISTKVSSRPTAQDTQDHFDDFLRFTINGEAFELYRFGADLVTLLPPPAPAVNCDLPVGDEASRQLTRDNGYCSTDIWAHNVPGLSNNGDPADPTFYRMVAPRYSVIGHAIHLLSLSFFKQGKGSIHCLAIVMRIVNLFKKTRTDTIPDEQSIRSAFQSHLPRIAGGICVGLSPASQPVFLRIATGSEAGDR
jgi:hypothetical protein